MSPTPTLVLSELTLDAIQAEATNAHLKHGEQSMLGPSHTDEDRYAILAEEAGEATDEALAVALMLLASSTLLAGKVGSVARELNEIRLGNRDGKGRLIRELIQVAAMAGSWVEALEGDAR
jgi:hypothetical protein